MGTSSYADLEELISKLQWYVQLWEEQSEQYRRLIELEERCERLVQELWEAHSENNQLREQLNMKHDRVPRAAD